MFTKGKIMFICCETPLHAGTGSDIGIVDLPIQREGHTHLPKIEGSGIKGALREYYTKAVGEDVVSSLFGPENNPDRAGAMGFSNARLLLFPVKSLSGTFAWLTCPQALAQLERDYRLLKGQEEFEIILPDEPLEDDACFALTKDPHYRLTSKGEPFALFEEFLFKIQQKSIKVKEPGSDEGMELQDWLTDQALVHGQPYWKQKLKSGIAVVSDSLFRDFTEFYTEIVRRIRINSDTGTVKGGALFSIEYLPQESILYSRVLAGPEFSSDKDRLSDQEVMDFFMDDRPSLLQIGGDATLNKGIVRLNFTA